ncbi:hypothetical protein CsatB_029225 [Cannabis sativa]
MQSMNMDSSSSPVHSHLSPMIFYRVKPMPSPRSADQGGSNSFSNESQSSSTHPSHSSRTRRTRLNHSSRININSSLLPKSSIRTDINKPLTGIQFPFQSPLFTVKSV